MYHRFNSLAVRFTDIVLSENGTVQRDYRILNIRANAFLTTFLLVALSMTPIGKEPVASNHLDGSTFPLIACSLISNSFPAIAVFVYTSIYAFRNVVVFQ